MVRARVIAVMVLAGCGSLAGTVPAPPPPPRPPLADGEAAPLRQLRPGVLHGLMTAGELRLRPDAELTAAIERDGDHALLTMVTVCLDVTGAATLVVTRPSRLPAFDRAALDVAAAWRFRPYVDGATPTAACSVAVFRRGTVAPSAEAPPADWEDALPAAEIELPPSRYVPDAPPADTRSRRPTPGVAMARVCRQMGSGAAPELAWLQSSGDPLFDRDLFERRATAPVGEPSMDVRGCALWVAIRRPADPARAFEAEPNPASAVTVASEVLSAQRIAGDTFIVPSDALKDAIQASGIHGFMVSIKVCVDRAGRPATLTLLSSSGYAGYDMDLVNGVASWRYRPMTVDGQPVPVCSLVAFAYRQR